jgi:hypothetical protein
MTKTKLSMPLNQKAFVLHSLLNRPFISERDFNYNGFRSRLSDLRLDYGVQIDYRLIPFVNEFGRKRTYRQHFIKDANEEHAIIAYQKMNKSCL